MLRTWTWSKENKHKKCKQEKKKDYRNSFHLEKLLTEHQSLKSQIKEKQIPTYLLSFPDGVSG